MNVKFLIAGFAAFVISMGGGFIAHGILLHGDYAQLPNLMRTDADAAGYLPFMLASHLIKGFAFAWVYSKGVSAGSPWIVQGLKFGIAAAFLIAIPLYLVYYSVEPMPGMLVAKQIIFDSITMIIMAIVVAALIKPGTTANA